MHFHISKKKDDYSFIPAKNHRHSTTEYTGCKEVFDIDVFWRGLQ